MQPLLIFLFAHNSVCLFICLICLIVFLSLAVLFVNFYAPNDIWPCCIENCCNITIMLYVSLLKLEFETLNHWRPPVPILLLNISISTISIFAGLLGIKGRRGEIQIFADFSPKKIGRFSCFFLKIKFFLWRSNI